MTSKIGRKLLSAIIICISLTVITVSIVTIAMSNSHSNTLLTTMANTGMNALSTSFESNVERIQSTADYVEVSGVVFMGADELSEIINERSTSSGDFAAFYSADGTLYWKSDNYKLSDFAINKNVEDYLGIVKDSNADLTIQCRKSIKRGGVVQYYGVVGMYLEADDWLDTVKQQSDTDVTIFSGKTRLSTTVMDSNNERIVGTEMAEKVQKVVLEQFSTYEGTADVGGQRHSVVYEPLYDINGEVVGAYFSGVSTAESDVLRDMMVIVTIIVALVAIAASTFMIGIITTKVMINPINDAKHLAEMMSNGILSQAHSRYASEKNEMGEFIKSLEETTGTLDDYISDIKNVLAEMATGDFTATPKVDYVGDFSDLKYSFKEIHTQLSDIIRNINHTASDVAQGSRQISEGSQLLSDGTMQQAQAVDELSSTITEITKELQKTAENAQEAGRISTDSCNRIIAQNDEVMNMLSAMDEIKEKSDKILDIIQAIDDIAFQTNILALNAAIEAARAGEAGKGFAVVADEVRNLAEKSAESAKETNALIHSTIESVNRGAVLAKNTSVTMKDVMNLSTQTNEFVEKISDASNDQANAIEQVKIGIEKISAVVQNNSATAEESAAACSRLNEEAESLREQIRKLKV